MKRNFDAFNYASELAQMPVDTPEEKAAAEAAYEQVLSEVRAGVSAKNEGPTFDEQKTKGLLAKLAKLIESS